VSNPHYEVNCNVHSSVLPLQKVVTTFYCPWCSHHSPRPDYELLVTYISISLIFDTFVTPKIEKYLQLVLPN